MRLPRLAIAPVLALLAVAAACGGGGRPDVRKPADTPPAEGAITPEARAEAKQIFATRCTPCHGPQGHGDGPASAGLTPPPRNLGEASWQVSVTDEHVERIIQYGGSAVGKSPAMPPNPDLASKLLVVKALREHVRSLGQK